MTPRTEAIAYRIWGYASPRGWDVTVAQICDALSVSASVVGAVLQAKGWHSRVRAGIDRYSGLSSAGGLCWRLSGMWSGIWGWIGWWGMLKVLDLFSGIGGFSLGLERTGGFETVAFCEIEPFPRRVLAKHWPGVPCYEDVRTLTADRLAADGITGINVITGGFPCQDISTAGKQAGLGEGTRSGLWSEIVRLVGELRPDYVIVENVANLLSGPSERRGGWFGRILGDLAECGYDAEWRNIPAWLVGLPHERERVWIVAYPRQERWARVLPTFASECEAAQFGQNQAAIALAASRRLDARSAGKLDGEPPFFDGTYGVSDLVAGLGAGGNAVVPQIPEMIGHAILAAHHTEPRRFCTPA